jgi:hypothetical protein
MEKVFRHNINVYFMAMKRELKMYLMGIKSLSAWEKQEIFDHILKLYKVKKSIIIFKTALFTMAFLISAAIFILSFILNG